jgi:predicted HTH transcriptional regulator
LLAFIYQKLFITFAGKKSNSMNSYLEELITAGEHQTQDFKFVISDSRKIARTLAAFANTDGGRLLVGVKDNGRISGVVSEEEYYMIDLAAVRYCKPAVEFVTKILHSEGKTVMEVVIPKSNGELHKAPDNKGNYKVFLRVNDHNLPANSIQLKAWKMRKENNGILLKFCEHEKILLKYLEKNETITFSKFQRIAGIKSYVAEKIMASFLAMDLLEVNMTDHKYYYTLKCENL